MNFPLNFIAQTHSFNTLEKHIPAPLFRRKLNGLHIFLKNMAEFLGKMLAVSKLC